jgi:amidase
MQDFDAILCPVMGYPAPPHGFSAEADFDIRGYVGYTHPYSLLGWPSVVVPAGTSADGLPIDVQIVARPWREDVALAAARLLEAALGGWRPLPEPLPEPPSGPPSELISCLHDA